MFVLHYKPG